MYFFGFVNTLWLNCLYLVWITIHDIDRRVSEYNVLIAYEIDTGVPEDEREYKNAWLEAFKEIWIVPVVIILSGLALLALTVLVGYHYKLACYNQITYE